MTLLSVSTFSSAGASASEAAVNVDVDASFLVQLGLFIVLLLILKPLLFDPMLKLFEEREKQTVGTIAKAREEDEKSAKALAKYEVIVGKGREAGATEANVLRAEGAKREAALLADVRTVTATTLEQGRAAIAQEAKAAREGLRAEAGTLGREIAARVLGREVSS
jgi:F-type H+-transporting ATPase subunit b